MVDGTQMDALWELHVLIRFSQHRVFVEITQYPGDI